MRITETDIDTRPEGLEDAMTAQEWWSEFRSNICCVGRAAQDCGCGGYTAMVPGDISPLLGEGEDQ